MKPPSRGGCGAPRSAERVRLQQALADAVGLSPTEVRAPGPSPKPNSGSPGHTRESVERLLRDERINRTQIIGFRGQTAYRTGPLRGSRPRLATDRGWHAGSGPGCVRFPGCRPGCRRARRVAGANIPSRGCRRARLAARGCSSRHRRRRQRHLCRSERRFWPALGRSGDAIEAHAFAYLAVCTLQGAPITFPGTTGV
jgi:hypothetical protein